MSRFWQGAACPAGSSRALADSGPAQHSGSATHIQNPMMGSGWLDPQGQGPGVWPQVLWGRGC